MPQCNEKILILYGYASPEKVRWAISRKIHIPDLNIISAPFYSRYENSEILAQMGILSAVVTCFPDLVAIFRHGALAVRIVSLCVFATERAQYDLRAQEISRGDGKQIQRSIPVIQRNTSFVFMVRFLLERPIFIRRSQLRGDVLDTSFRRIWSFPNPFYPGWDQVNSL